MSITKASVIAAAEKLGWSVKFGTQPNYQSGRPDKYAEFENSSPAGEDLVYTEFYHSLSELPKLIWERYCDFNPEQHASDWYGSGNGEPSSLRVLLDDADAIEDMIFQLAEALPA